MIESEIDQQAQSTRNGNLFNDCQFALRLFGKCAMRYLPTGYTLTGDLNPKMVKCHLILSLCIAFSKYQALIFLTKEFHAYLLILQALHSIRAKRTTTFILIRNALYVYH